MAFRLHRLGTLALFGAAAACSAATPSSPDPEPVSSSTQAATGTCATPVIVDQSLFVAAASTNASGVNTSNPFGVAALADFSFQAVMNQIVKGTSVTALELYQQLVGTMNKPPCTGEINGFPVDCPRSESVLDTTNPFSGTIDLMVPIALVNRFDLAPNNGANCGEYRIVFAIPGAKTAPVARFLMIFEATLPNPNPAGGLSACLPVAQFWDSLSASTVTTASFAASLKKFYFNGLPAADGGVPFSPVISAENYGIGFPKNTNTGQIRVNMLSNQQWQLRQFELSETCPDGGVCDLVASNSFVANNPFGGLFNSVEDGGTGNQTFQNEFINRVKSLSATTIPRISMTTNNLFNAGQSSEQDQTNQYSAQASGNTKLTSALQAELTKLDSGLTPLNIINRATTQSCAGCHELSPFTNLGGPDGGLVWPASNVFTQVSELSSPLGQQSPALVNSFLPFRSAVLTSFINKRCGGVAEPGDEGDGTENIGGGQSGSSN